MSRTQITKSLDLKATAYQCAALFVITITAAIAHAGDQEPPQDVPVRVPDNYDPAVPAPLLIMLHGYSNTTGDAMENWLQLWPVANANGFLYATPTGSFDSWGNYYWNATHNCCDYDEANIDHVGYLAQLIDAITTQYNVDPNQIHLLGYSNGGYMCYRMACDRGDLIASIVSIAGVTWLNPDNCPAADPVHVLQIHGTNDTIVLYEGGYDPWNPPHPYPGAVETVEQWATANGCIVQGDEDPIPFDVDFNVIGAEAHGIDYTVDCEPNGSATLWRLQGSSHFIEFTSQSKAKIFQFMLEHAKNNATCMGDIDGDDMVGVSDLLALIDVWGTPATDADINGDGVVNILDLLVVLATWGECT